jgi:hypothetical protein
MSLDARTDLLSADIQMIQRLLPHRYPFLLIDKVRDIVPFKSAVGVKNVTYNEPHFQGHFPGVPIMPGVTIIEAMAQTAAVMVGVSSDYADKELLVYFMGIDRREVPPQGRARRRAGTGHRGHARQARRQGLEIRGARARSRANWPPNASSPR